MYRSRSGEDTSRSGSWHGGRTNGIRAETIRQAHALGGDAIRIRCFVDAAAVTAHDVSCLVIRHDKSGNSQRYTRPRYIGGGIPANSLAGSGASGHPVLVHMGGMNYAIFDGHTQTFAGQSLVKLGAGSEYQSKHATSLNRRETLLPLTPSQTGSFLGNTIEDRPKSPIILSRIGQEQIEPARCRNRAYLSEAAESVVD